MKQVETLPTGVALSEYIGDRIEALPKSQRDVAQYIVDHIDEAAFQTAEELARRVSTSSSTVVRFSQNIGFEGFPELQRAAQDEYRKRSGQNGDGGKNGEAGIASLEKSEFEAALTTDWANVEETAGKVPRTKIEATTKAVVKAEKVLVVALDQLSFFGGYLRYLLSLLDISVEVIGSPGQESLRKIANITSRTLVIGLVAGRPDPLVVRAFKLARHRKGVAALIADASLSDAGKHANISFYYSSNSPSYVRSNTALLSFIQALAYGVYAQDSDGFSKSLKGK